MNGTRPTPAQRTTSRTSVRQPESSDMSMYVTDQRCPSRSWNGCMYIGPCSTSSPVVPPAAATLVIRSSTSARLSADNPTSTSRAVDGSTAGASTYISNVGSAWSMTYAWSLITMQLVFSSANWSLNSKPAAVKNSRALARSFTGRLTKVSRDMRLSWSYGDVDLLTPLATETHRSSTTARP